MSLEYEPASEPQGAITFCEGLAQAPSLRRLNLSFNSFGEDNGVQRSPALYLGPITHNLSDNPLKTETTSEFA